MRLDADMDRVLVTHNHATFIVAKLLNSLTFESSDFPAMTCDVVLPARPGLKVILTLLEVRDFRHISERRSIPR